MWPTIWLVLAASMIHPAAAQSDILSEVLSEAISVFTSVTSVLGATTASATSSAASSTSSTSSDNPSTTTSASTATPTASSTVSTPTSTSSSSTAAAAAAASTTGTSSGGGGGTNNTLAIVLGCTLGALALATFLLILLLFCRRRRRRSARSKLSRSSSVGTDEVESWKMKRPPTTSAVPVGSGNLHGNQHNSMTDSSLMVEHPHHTYPYNDQEKRIEHTNPFVPLPPAPRRSGPHYYADTSSRRGDSYEPYLGNSTYSVPNELQNGSNQRGSGTAFAAGAGGAALGAAAMHHHDKARDSTYSDRDAQHQFDPRAGSLHPVHPPSGQSNPKFIEAPGVIGARPDKVSRRSADSSRSRARSVSRDDFATPDQWPHDQKSRSSTEPLAAGAGGVVAGALLAQHHNKSKTESQDRSPAPKGILKRRTSDPGDSTSSRDYVDALPAHRAHTPTNTLSGRSDLHELPVSDLPSDIPPTPPLRSRRNSALGTAAPAAAIGSYVNEPNTTHRGVQQANRYSSSSDAPPLPPIIIPTQSKKGATPNVPSRSPRRSSLTPNARYSVVNDGTVEMPADVPSYLSPQVYPEHGAERERVMSPVSPIHGAQRDTDTTDSTPPISENQHSYRDNDDPDSTLNSKQSSGLLSAMKNIFGHDSKNIVDDGGYPHMNVPRRRSGGEYDYSSDGPLGPPTARLPRRKPLNPTAAPPPASWGYGRVSGGLEEDYAIDTTEDHDLQDPHTVPDRREYAQNTQRRRSGSRTLTRDHDSGVSGLGSGSDGGFTLADIRREEEERELQRQRELWENQTHSYHQQAQSHYAQGRHGNDVGQAY